MNRRQFLCGVAAAALVPAVSTRVNPDLERLVVEFHERLSRAWAATAKGVAAEWSTDDLKYPPFRVARPPNWRDWYGVEGL